MAAKRFALVLSGGGPVGVAWETGVLKGLRDGGADLTHPGLFVGTSAGAIVSAQLATGHDLDELFARQLQPPEPGPTRNLEPLMRAMGEIRRRAALPDLARLTPPLLAELGAAAREAQTESEESRLATVKSYLPSADAWPERALRITALDTADGSLVVWDRNSKATLLEAVASSCAAPLIAPPTTIGGRRYMDAGPLSATHAQLAAGYELVTVVAVARPGPLGPLDDETATLRAAGSRVEFILPDAPSMAAIFPNLLDRSRGKAAAQAGRDEGLARAATVREWLK